MALSLAQTSTWNVVPDGRAPDGRDPASTPATPGVAGGAPTDAALLRATSGGDRDAFRVLVERYERRAFWAAFHLLGDEEEARDVVQEAFVRVYRSMDRFDERRPFYTWFYRIVTNLAIDHLRHMRLTRRIASEEATESLAGGAPPSSPVESNETRRNVRRALDLLPPKFKAVMVLRELHGLSCKEIATIVSSTHATVRWRMHRARKLFREAYDRVATQ
jgi:RNA polymerase sigma-70 factor, ECF subfamily